MFIHSPKSFAIVAQRFDFTLSTSCISLVYLAQYVLLVPFETLSYVPHHYRISHVLEIRLLEAFGQNNLGSLELGLQLHFGGAIHDLFFVQRLFALVLVDLTRLVRTALETEIVNAP